MSGLVADHLVGTQYPWPLPDVDESAFFDRPSWERPTLDNPYVRPDIPDKFYGEPGILQDFVIPASPNDEPGFIGGLPAGTTWISPDPLERDDGGTVLIVTDLGVRSIQIEAARRDFFRIEVYDPDGERLSAVPKWISGTLTRVLDKASTLQFRAAVGAEGAADLVRPNTIWLRDRWGFVIDTFQIQKRRPVGTGDASYFDIEAQGKITQLARELVHTYDGGRVTVAEHVNALFAMQMNEYPIPIGVIDETVGDTLATFYAQDTNIHAALLQLQFAMPRANRGRFYVDPQGRFQWREAPGDLTESVITREMNVRSISAEINYDDIVNEIWIYGEGNDPETRLKLSDGDTYATDYVQDAASIAAYGLHPALKIDRRVRYVETLEAIALRILEEFAEPPTVVEVELLDVAKADNAPAGIQDIDIGGRYRVVDAALGLDTSIEIVSIETDLSRPVPIRVNLANQTRGLADTFQYLLDATVQPLDVDGDRYPTMGRNYSSSPARAERAGDVRWNDGTGGGDPRGQMHDGTDWQDMGGGDQIWYTAATKAELLNDETILETALGRVTGGAQQGMVCIRNPNNDGWDAINFFE